MRRWSLSTCVLLMAAAVPAPAQKAQAPPSALTFRVGVHYVEADVIVTDAQGRFVRDLARGDFDVLEDGKSQDVSVFSLVDIPFERRDRPLDGSAAVPPDVAGNAAPFGGRVFTIVLDALHIDAAYSVQVKAQARQFIEREFAANDLGAVVHIGDPDAGQDFTSNPSLLLASIDRFTSRKIRSAALNKLDVSAQVGLMPGGAAEDAELELRASTDQQALKVLAQLCVYLGNLHGRRKAVLLWSQGIDFNTEAGAGTDPATNTAAKSAMLEAQAVLDAEHAMVIAATRANVSIYPIDPRGPTSGDDVALRAPPSQNYDPQAERFSPVSGEIAREVQRGQETLRLFADQTGGFVTLNTNDFAAVYGRLLEDNSSYYVLGYDSPFTKTDGSFRKVTVKLKRPGLQVRTRPGYFAAATAAPAPSGGKKAPVDPVHDLLASPAPVPGLGVRVTAAPFKNGANGATIELVVEIDGRDVKFESAGGRFSNDVDVVYEAVDSHGDVKAANRATMALHLQAATHQAVAQHGIRLAAEFGVPAGRYQLRVAAHERVGDLAGSVVYDFDVPDYRKALLSLSGVVMTASAANAIPTSGSLALTAAILPTVATTVRTFARSETLTAFAEVYDNDSAHPHTVDISAAVRADDGHVVFSQEDARDSQELGTARSAYGARTVVPLADFTPGRYVLSITAKSRLSKDAPVVRAVPFEVK
jgi:VWFA-related protein